MNSKDLLASGLIFALVVAVIILAVRSSTNAARTEEAHAMSAELVATLRELSYPSAFAECHGLAPGEYGQLEECLRASRASKDLSKLFREDKFQNYDERQNRTGFLVIENEQGGRTYASANFTLRFNNQELARGCLAPGEIAPGYTCRFNLERACAPGDNLEIKYNDRRAFLRTC